MDDLKQKIMVLAPKLLEYTTISGVAFALVRPETLGFLFGHAFEDSVMKAGLAFMLAAWIHSGRVKKEIATMALGVKDSINKVAEALRADLEKQTGRLDKIEHGFEKLNTRVETLEKGG